MTILRNEDLNTAAWEDTSPLAPPADQCSVARWIVTAPWAHPAWQQYWLTLVHLRDIPGVPPAHRYDKRATHELQIWAMDPKVPHAPGESLKPRSLLQPQNFVGQRCFVEDDIEAGRYLRQLVGAIVAGVLSPDTDFRFEWKRMWPYNPYDMDDGA